MDMKWLRPRLKSFVNRIDVFYDKDKNEHELVVRFKLPLISGKNDLQLTLKKTERPHKWR